MGFKLTLAGDQGSGKSTVGKLLTEKTGAIFYSAGFFMRQCAREMGMDIADFNVYSESHPEIDYQIDTGLERLNDDERDMIIDSRMAWYFVRDSFKVYLFSDPTECAKRILSDSRDTEHFDSLEKTVEKLQQRRQSECKRYSELYKVQIKDPDNYTLLVDTTFASPEEECEKILLGLKKWKNDRNYHRGYICPPRLYYPDDAPDTELIDALTVRIERGEEVPEVKIFDKDGACYAVENAESAIACALCSMPYVPFVYTKTPPAETMKFVKMENLR